MNIECFDIIENSVYGENETVINELNIFYAINQKGEQLDQLLQGIEGYLENDE